MIDSNIFDHLQKHYEWLDSYKKSVENLGKIKQVMPGVSKYEVVAEIDKVRLLRYTSETRDAKIPPLVISYALVNRFTIADLQDGKSLVQSLLANGVDVYVIDWGYPDPADKYLDLDDYVNGYMDFCINYVKNQNKGKPVNLLGICQGGALSICYTALHGKNINKLVTMVTPVDFQTKDDILSHMVRKVDVHLYIKAFGNLSGHLLNNNFNMLQPINLNLKKWLSSVDSLSDEKFAKFFLNMEAWINDSPDQAAKAYAEFIDNFYQKNAFIKGGLEIGGQKVDLKKITQPVLNVYGNQDHLVPPASSQALKKLVSSKGYKEMPIETGHIGMYVSGKAKNVPYDIATWLKK